jgi:hypothetical protein
MQKFWDSAFALEPPEDYDTNRYFGNTYVVYIIFSVELFMCFVLFCSANSYICFVAVKSLDN